MKYSCRNFATYSTGNVWYLEHFHDPLIPRAQWYCPQVNMTWLHHWWVNIGLNNDLVSSGNKPLPWPMFSKICMSLSRSQRVNIFTDSRWTDRFFVVKIFGSTSMIHLSDVTVSDRYLIVNVDPGSMSPGLLGSQAPLTPSNWSALYRRSWLASHELNTPQGQQRTSGVRGGR